MRATLGTTYRTLQSQLNRMGNRLNDLRQVAASGKKLNKASDDPSAIRPVLSSQSLLRVNDCYLKTMGTALDRLQISEGHFDHMENILAGAHETVIASLNGTYTAEDRIDLANKIGQLKEELVDTANAKFDGKFIFAGYNEQTKPFDISGAYDPITYDPADDQTWPVQYSGDANAFSLEISPGETIEIAPPGCGLFLGDADNDGAVDSGKVDIFSVLTRIEDALRANDPAAIEAEIENLQNGTDQIRYQRGKMGNNAAKIERTMGTLENAQADIQSIISRYEDADIIEAITNMTQQETAFQAALQVTSQVSRLSILNYL